MNSTTKAALSYVFGFISGLIFLAVEKEDEFVRKCAAQSFVFSLGWSVLVAVIRWIPFLGGILSGILGLVFFVLWIVLIVKAAGNTYFRLPVISDFSEQYVLKWFR